MSWGIKMIGTRAAVASSLRQYKNRQGIYPDMQRDAVLEQAADQVEKMTNASYDGVIVEGSGHQGSNYQIRIDQAEVAHEATPDVVVASAPPA